MKIYFYFVILKEESNEIGIRAIYASSEKEAKEHIKNVKILSYLGTSDRPNHFRFGESLCVYPFH